MTRRSIPARIRATVTDFNRYAVGKGKFTLAVDTWPDISASVSLPSKILILLYVHTTMLARPEQHVIFGIGVANHVLCSIKPPPPQKSRVSPYSCIIMLIGGDDLCRVERSLWSSPYSCVTLWLYLQGWRPSPFLTQVHINGWFARLLVINVTQHAPLLLSTTITCNNIRSTTIRNSITWKFYYKRRYWQGVLFRLRA